MPTKRDYYEILGLSKSASADEIKKAHRKLVRKYHPDANKEPTAQDKFKEIQEAYDILSEPDKRQKYDQFGHAGVGTAPPPGSAGDPYEQFRRQSARPGSRSRPGGPGVSVEDFNFGGGAPGDFGSVFEQLFGAQAARGQQRSRRPQPQQPAPPQRGQDIEHETHISLQDAARGSSLSLQISRDGKLETIDVKIPAGVKEGSRIRLKGRGQQLIGGTPGDLFIITRIDPHPFLRRDDLDLSMDVPISLYEALQGAKVDVPTLDGPLTVTIPPGTSSHAKLRLKGHGIHRGPEKGDQFAIIKIILPKNLSEEEKQSILNLSKSHPLDARADVKW
jgi:DnaJ-class molecular chaperone